MRTRSIPLLLIALVPFLLGAAVPTAPQPIFERLPDMVYDDLGTAGRPRFHPRVYFGSRYTDHAALPEAIDLFYAGRYHEAFRVMEEGGQIREPETHAWRALICYRQGNYAESVASANRALAQDSRTGLAHLALGLAYNPQRNPLRMGQCRFRHPAHAPGRPAGPHPDLRLASLLGGRRQDR